MELPDPESLILPKEHNIHNFRIMPYHLDLLVMISIPTSTTPDHPQDLTRPPPCVILGPREKEGLLYGCIFSIPSEGEDVRDIEPFECKLFEECTDFEHVQISDPVRPSRMDRSIRPLSFQADDPPVCIYYRNLSTQQLMEIRIRPCRPDSLQPLRNTYFGTLNCFWQMNYDRDGDSGVLIANVLPAHSRPLVWTTLRANRTDSPPLSNIYSHIHEVRADEGVDEWELEEDEIDMDEELEDENPLAPILARQKPSRAQHGAVLRIPVTIRKVLRFGVKALAWDDWSGRIFVATLDDCMIHVLDLGQGPREGHCLHFLAVQITQRLCRSKWATKACSPCGQADDWPMSAAVILPPTYS
jgi:hypothetical protein